MIQLTAVLHVVFIGFHQILINNPFRKNRVEHRVGMQEQNLLRGDAFVGRIGLALGHIHKKPTIRHMFDAKKIRKITQWQCNEEYFLHYRDWTE